MKNLHRHHLAAFTLIELIVSMVIFAIIMVSVISVFIFSTQLSGKIEINRVLQENIKNVVETIAEDIRKTGLVWVSDTLLGTCLLEEWTFSIGTKLCTGSSQYYFAKQDTSGWWIRIEQPDLGCSELIDSCRIVRKDTFSWDVAPLSNNFVTFRDFSFSLFGWEVPYVSLNFLIQPAVGNGVRPDLIEQSKLIFQTSISERMIKTN